MNYTGKSFSVLGDSMSTFKGFTAEEGVFYGRSMCRKGGFTDHHDSWWMRVIDGASGVLERNNSYSGSCVAPVGLFDCASSNARCAALGNPDVILIFLGANDAGFGVSAADFERAYDIMLARLKDHYPAAQIWCATQVNGKKVLPDEPYFGGSDPSIDFSAHNAAIRRSCEKAGCHLADIAKTDLVYDAIDGAHPTKAGMAAIADAFLTFLRI